MDSLTRVIQNAEDLHVLYYDLISQNLPSGVHAEILKVIDTLPFFHIGNIQADLLTRVVDMNVDDVEDFIVVLRCVDH